jgi:hypothetical protein
MTTYWWFRPSRIALMVAMPLAIFAYAASNQYYQKFGAFNAITAGDFFVAWLSILGFAGASWIAELLVADRAQKPSPYIRESDFRTLWFGLALVSIGASAIYMAPIFSNPSLLLDIFKADSNAAYIARSQVDQIPGVTSLVNLSGLVAVLFMLKPTLTRSGRTHTETLTVAILVFLTALRMIVHDERLSLIELLLPLLLLTSALSQRTFRWAVAPVAGVLGLYVFFTATEYLRSWASFYSTRSDSLLVFALDRMIGYYMTAINNGAFIYDQQSPYYFPVRTGSWLWSLPLPGLADTLSTIAGTPSSVPAETDRILSAMNLEFNNTSGIFAPFIDFGPVLGVLVWVLLGYLSGRLFRAFVEKRWLGLVLFPTWYAGVLEIPRVFYWGDQRYFPPLVISLVVVFIFRATAQGHERVDIDFDMAATVRRGYPTSGDCRDAD